MLSKPICCSGDSYAFFMAIWDKGLINLQEQVYFLFLNGQNEVICWRCINTGTGGQTPMDIKFAMACALGCMAAKIIIAHNHPSGRLTPSVNDLGITTKLNSAAALMDIKLADHVIIAGKKYYSFIDHGYLKG